MRTLLICLFVTSLTAFAQPAARSNAARVKAKPVFTTPISWCGDKEPSEPETERLLGAIHEFESNGAAAGFLGLEGFVAANPKSSWTPSLNMHLAEYYREMGRYSLAMIHWEAAWNGSKDANDASSRDVAARTITGWMGLLANLGRLEEIDELMAQAKRLGVDRGSYATRMHGIRDSLASMKRRPEISYRCGTYALAQLMTRLQPTNALWRTVNDSPSPDGGFSMDQLVQIAASNGCQVVAARRVAGNEIIVPSVVHWKLNHFAAILDRTNHQYLVQDPTFGGQKWIDESAINGEASGEFLLAANTAPDYWRVLTADEARMIKGKGGPNLTDDADDDDDDDNPPLCPPPPPPDPGDGPGGGGTNDCSSASSDPDSDDDSSSEEGMAVWQVSEPYITLWLHDVPLSYRNSKGSKEYLRLSYKHRGESVGPSIGGFGDRWSCNWLGFIEEPSNVVSHVTNYLAGGGRAGFAINGDKEYKSGRALTVRTNGVRIIETPYSHQNRYGYPIWYSAQGIVRYMLTNRVDPFGRTTSYTYETVSSSVVRLTAITDQDGKQCTFCYSNSAHPNLITCVTDPYGRSAYFTYDFTYDSSGWLASITDTMGMTSSFTYNSDGSISNLHTDYGDTGFQYFSGANSTCDLNRAIEVTEATGAKQLYVYRDNTTSGYGSHDSDTAWPMWRNSYHWNRQQYTALSEDALANYLDMPDDDYLKGSIKHWLHGSAIGTQSSVSGTLDSSAGPAVDGSNQRVNCIAYQYGGAGSESISALRAVTSIRWSYGSPNGNRTDFTRNSWGRPVTFVYYRNGGTVTFSNEFNPDGRILKRVWGPHNERIRGYGYDGTLTTLLTSVTNALNYETRFTYDSTTYGSAVRPLTVTYPSGLVSSNVYYASGTYAGFLKDEIDFQSGAPFRTNSYGYLSGNILTHTNELRLVRNYTWDDLNRHTSTIFPDQTTISNRYDKLDRIGHKDRLNNWTMYAYNNIRQLTSRTDANGGLTEIGYCDCGSPSQITRWNGSHPLITYLYYDLAGRTTNTVYPDAYVLSYFYADHSHDRGGPIRIEDSAGLAMHYEFADYWQIGKIGLSPAQKTTPDGYLVTRLFDEYGRLTNSVDRNGVTVTNAYDFLDRPLSRTTLDISGHAHGKDTFSYTARGMTNWVDALNHTNWFVYDPAGRLLFETNANKELLQFTYNPSDETLTLIDGKLQTTAWNYDEYGLTTNKVDAANNVIFRYKYDQNWHLTNRWSAAKGDTFYRWDKVGNLTNVDYPGSTMDIALSYDPLDRLTNIVDAIGTNKFTYDDAFHLLTDDGPWNDDTVRYAYYGRQRNSMSIQADGAAGSPSYMPYWIQYYNYDRYRRLSTVSSMAGCFGYTYSQMAAVSDRVVNLALPCDAQTLFITNRFDELARLTNTALYLPGGSSPANQHAYALNDGDQRTRQIFTAGNYMDYSYDGIGQLTNALGKESGGVNSRLQEQFKYTYDKAWNLSNRVQNALTSYFNVNNLNELTTETNGGTLTVAGALSSTASSVSVSGTGLSPGSATLYNDNTWVRSGAAFQNGVNTYTANATDPGANSASDAVTANFPGTNFFSYDLNGNLTSDGLRYFEYDYENQLSAVTVSNGWRSEFRYDGFSRRRVTKEYTWNAGAWVATNEVHFIYDGPLVVQERWYSNAVISDPSPGVTYTRGNDLSGTLQAAGGIGGLLARSQTTKLLVTGGFTNWLPPISHAYYHSDGNGNITALANLSGKLAAHYTYDPFGNILAKSGALADVNVYRFSSKEYHPNSGLVYYLYRFYDSYLQKWVNRDPAGEDAGINLFSFVNNAATLLFDAFGLCPPDDSADPPLSPDAGKALADWVNRNTHTPSLLELPWEKWPPPHPSPDAKPKGNREGGLNALGDFGKKVGSGLLDLNKDTINGIKNNAINSLSRAEQIGLGAAIGLGQYGAGGRVGGSLNLNKHVSLFGSIKAQGNVLDGHLGVKECKFGVNIH
jgi:RHS repeat-associated protein